MENSDNPVRSPEAAKHDSASTNGATTLEQNAHPQANSKEQVMHQAEEMADRLAERIGIYASWLSRAVMRVAARAREEAADIWAEAEHISQKGRS